MRCGDVLFPCACSPNVDTIFLTRLVLEDKGVVLDKASLGEFGGTQIADAKLDKLFSFDQRKDICRLQRVSQLSREV